MSILESIVPVQLPYPIRGAIIRSIRTGVAILLAGVSASIADGSIIKDLAFIPAAYSPVVIMALTTTFVGVDKWLRERGLVEEAQETAASVPVTDNTSVVSVPAPAVNVPPKPDSDLTGPTPVEPVVEPITDEATDDGVIEDGENPTIFDDPSNDTTP
jgi:hypothetical protein